MIERDCIQYEDIESEYLKAFSSFDLSNCLGYMPGRFGAYKYCEISSRTGIKVYLKEGADISNLPKITYQGIYSGDNYVFLSGNYTSRLEFKLFSGGNVVFGLGDSKWCRFRGQVEVRDKASIVLGRGISSNDVHINASGQSVLIGDDCMIAAGVKIRTHSGHAFLDLDTGELSTKSNSLVVEPHVWLGENAKLFMCSRVGSCSIVAYGSLVTAVVEDFSVAKGHPAKNTPLKNKLWLRSKNRRNVSLAEYFYKKMLSKRHAQL